MSNVISLCEKRKEKELSEKPRKKMGSFIIEQYEESSFFYTEKEAKSERERFKDRRQDELDAHHWLCSGKSKPVRQVVKDIKTLGLTLGVYSSISIGSLVYLILSMGMSWWLIGLTFVSLMACLSSVIIKNKFSNFFHSMDQGKTLNKLYGPAICSLMAEGYRQDYISLQTGLLKSKVEPGELLIGFLASMFIATSVFAVFGYFQPETIGVYTLVGIVTVFSIVDIITIAVKLVSFSVLKKPLLNYFNKTTDFLKRQ